jgi:hypothetical protein
MWYSRIFHCSFFVSSVGGQSSETILSLDTKIISYGVHKLVAYLLGWRCHGCSSVSVWSVCGVIPYVVCTRNVSIHRVSWSMNGGVNHPFDLRKKSIVQVLCGN